MPSAAGELDDNGVLDDGVNDGVLVGEEDGGEEKTNVIPYIRRTVKHVMLFVICYIRALIIQQLFKSKL